MPTFITTKVKMSIIKNCEKLKTGETTNRLNDLLSDGLTENKFRSFTVKSQMYKLA